MPASSATIIAGASPADMMSIPNMCPHSLSTAVKENHKGVDRM